MFIFIRLQPSPILSTNLSTAQKPVWARRCSVKKTLLKWNSAGANRTFQTPYMKPCWRTMGRGSLGLGQCSGEALRIWTARRLVTKRQTADHKRKLHKATCCSDGTTPIIYKHHPKKNVDMQALGDKIYPKLKWSNGIVSWRKICAREVSKFLASFWAKLAQNWHVSARKLSFISVIHC